VTERWRFIDGGASGAPEAFGRMPAMAAGIAQGGPEVLLTLKWSKGHFQIGWFDDVDAVINLQAAREAGVDVFRRPVWGGGTAFYDTDAVAVWSWFVRDDHFPTLDAALEYFRPLMEAALKDVGLGAAHFEGSSDIRFEGRKLGTLITQAVLGTKVVGGFLNLRRPDLELYKRVARVPEEKFADKAIKDVVAYICTPDDVRGRPLSYEELRDAIVRASRELGGIELDPTPFTPEEDATVGQFVEAVRADSWIRRVSSERFRADAPASTRVGFANVKGKKLVRAGVALADGDAIERVMIAGDMHVSPPDAMDRVARNLVNANAHDRAEIVRRVQQVFDEPDVQQPDAAAGITAEDVAEAVARAAVDACASA
jgi:lipoate-protein ligase A